jgi:hypothetical protein
MQMLSLAVLSIRSRYAYRNNNYLSFNRRFTISFGTGENNNESRKSIYAILKTNLHEFNHPKSADKVKKIAKRERKVDLFESKSAREKMQRRFFCISYILLVIGTSVSKNDSDFKSPELDLHKASSL